MVEIFAGFRWVDPFTQFGEISLLLFISSLIAIIGFVIAAIYINKYNKKFYVGETPKGWKMFFNGLILVSLYQLLKVPYTYRWIYGDLFTIIFLIFQIVAVAFLAYGLYLLRKEVSL